MGGNHRHDAAADTGLPFEWGPLQVLEKLGEGSFGEVYRARDPALGREVALKLLRGDEATGSTDDWLDEARRLAKVRHPNVLTVHGAGTFSGLAGLWSDLLEGESLEERLLADGPFGEGEVVAVGCALCRALAALHRGGLVHGDIKTSNVIRTEDGEFVLIDLGASSEVDQPSTVWRQGSPATSAPEVLRGEASTSSSDLYSLGALLYRLASGAPVLRARSLEELLERALSGDIAPLVDLRPDLSPSLTSVIARALSADPGERYPTAGAMEAALVSGGRVRRRGRSWSWAAAALAALGVVAGASRFWFAQPEGGARSEGRVRRLVTQGDPVVAAISADGEYVAYTSSEGGFRLVGGGNSVRLQQIESGRDIELVPAVDFGFFFESLAFSPDGEYVRYTVGSTGTAKAVWQVPILGGDAELLAEDVLGRPTYSPDGGSLAFAAAEEFTDPWIRLDVVDLERGGRRTLLELTDGGELEEVAWSPDGKRIAFVVWDGGRERLRVVTPDGSDSRAVPSVSFPDIEGLCWAPDGRDLVVLAGSIDPFSMHPWLVDHRTGEQRRLLRDFHRYSGCSRDRTGAVTAMIRIEERAQLWVAPVGSPEGAYPVRTTTGRSDGSIRVTWENDDSLLYEAPGGEGWYLWRVPATGGLSTRVAAEPARAAAVDDSGRIVFYSGWTFDDRAGIYTVPGNGGPPRRLSPLHSYAERPTVSRDGEWIFYELFDGERWHFVRSERSGGEPIAVSRRQSHLASFSPDGRRFALHEFDPVIGRWGTAIYPFDTDSRQESEPTRWLDLHSETYSPWADDGSLFVSRMIDGVGNIYRVDLDDLEEQQVTFFREGVIFSFDLSPDGTRLAVSRGSVINDLLLVEGLLER